MTRIRSSLAPHAAAMRDPDPDAAWAAAERVWQEHGFALINPDEVERRLGWIAGQEARNLAVKCFGPREVPPG